MQQRFLPLALAIFALPFTSLAQTTGSATDPVEKTSPVITIKVDGISCTTTVGSGSFRALSWTFGASLPSSSITAGGGTSASRVSMQNLNLVRDFDECGPRLFAAVTSGQKFSTVTLTQTDAGGKNVLMTVKLQTVGIASYQIGGSPATDQPAEQISFSFSRITITNNLNNVSAGWDVTTNKAI